ncbi:WD40 repeat domain-containing protein [Salipiger sp.]|uniref:WD40 repeat domain-containing protein n=1 Tax=Salipiger sp. TaxID=2078585 RepID=UPI003A979D12
MIETKPPQATTLFDLIGREWALEGAVTGLTFNAVTSAVACAMEDGTLTMLPVADSEHPEKRIRMDLETGRTTIRPREGALPQPQRTERLRPGAALCALGGQGFAVAGEGASLWRVTARGQTVRLARDGVAPVSALCSVGTERICVARDGHLSLMDAEDMTLLANCALPLPVERLEASADGMLIVAWSPERFTILKAGTLAVLAVIAAPGQVNSLAWSRDRRWIAAGCEDKALVLVDVLRGLADRIVDFPAPVMSAGFNAEAGALVASGAFRVVGWRLPDLPFGDHEGDPIRSGRAGLTIVERVAPNPVRDTCAVGYASGLVTLCPLGGRDELMLREGAGAPVTALDWSGDGTHLAIGFADGRAGIVTFPKVMFK